MKPLKSICRPSSLKLYGMAWSCDKICRVRSVRSTLCGSMLSSPFRYVWSIRNLNAIAQRRKKHTHTQTHSICQNHQHFGVFLALDARTRRVYDDSWQSFDIILLMRRCARSLAVWRLRDYQDTIHHTTCKVSKRVWSS